MKIEWKRDSHQFTDNHYSRAHTWTFDGGIQVPASSSPHVVPLPLSNENAVDPEEAFVAALSSCHMLWFLSIAAKAGFCVDRYTDDALGVLQKDADGRLAMTHVTLYPRVVFSSTPPDPVTFERLHHEAHEACFIANSVKTEIRCNAVIVA